MRFDVVTLFPELFAPFLSSGINRRAFSAADDGTPPLVTVHVHQLRDFAQGHYRRVDDRPFGGGPGMVLMAEPLAQCVEQIQRERGDAAPVVLFSPIGLTLNHARVAAWTGSSGAILLCGRYEGLDQRFIDRFVTQQISLGDFVLSGGEIAALALLDAVARLQEGVLGDSQSPVQDSFHPAQGGLLDCPHYTRPERWRDEAVPAVLLGGNHAQIAQWRQAERERMTAQYRPDLLHKED